MAEAWTVDPGLAACETDERCIDYTGEFAHVGYSLNIPDKHQTYWLRFGVVNSMEDDKIRGPINNDGDKCWHFHGPTVDDWDVMEC